MRYQVVGLEILEVVLVQKVKSQQRAYAAFAEDALCNKGSACPLLLLPLATVCPVRAASSGQGQQCWENIARNKEQNSKMELKIWFRCISHPCPIANLCPTA